MYQSRDSRGVAPRQRCVVPFDAEPREVAGLRLVMQNQLRLWGTSGLAEQAELVVTELATNVIKHVGEGSPAALCLETRDGVLQIEMHDTSAELPACRLAGADDEGGRGLALIAALTDSWFAGVTASGKVVHCQLALSGAGSGHQCRRSISDFSSCADGEEAGSALAGAASATKETVSVLIANLLWWLAPFGADADDILNRAKSHFEAARA
ncbi:ATP-binding protein [Streptomyces sp. H39-S7]|uniref:ATP-binding protein n=1 Tax=Streptomyces sp. H39-S7 TaxID=3004357 RepID=UPI0022AF3757|nr:ATP-binding protein [Streptomyces sp. H39-S7]MCZ4125076.1 ATP-binding protein [Streptomyces sp. H39-S7]